MGLDLVDAKLFRIIDSLCFISFAPYSVVNDRKILMWEFIKQREFQLPCPVLMIQQTAQNFSS